MKLYIAALAGNLGMVSVGLFFGWSSPSVPLLMAEDSPARINSEQVAWVVSLFTFGATCGSLISALIVNVIGRKTSMLLTAVPAVIGWLMIAFASTPWELYTARFVCGLSSGVAYAVTPMYLGEISPPAVRGILASMLTVATKFGAVVNYFVGSFLSVRDLAFFCLSIPILFVVVFVWLPETPYHLMRRGRKEEAGKALAQLRGTKDTADELGAIEKSVKADLDNETGFKELLLVPGNRRALIISLGLMLAQQWSGSQVVVSYAQMIFDAADSKLEGKYLTMILGVVQVSFTVISALVVDRGGRRPLLILSTVGSAVSTAIVGIYFFLRVQYPEADVASSLSWLPGLGCILYIVMYCSGLAALPFTMLGELFPTNVKALGSTISIFCCNLSAFAVTSSYQFVAQGLGIHVAFWSFTVFSVLGALFTVLYVPETKGKTLQEIQEELHASSGKSS